jgi:hypothetical protein
MMFSESKLIVECNTLNFFVVSNSVQKKFSNIFEGIGRKLIGQ